MSSQQLQRNLGQLIAMRERELEQHQAQLATKEQLRTRYLNTVQRLEQLNQQIAPTGDGLASLAHNIADYKMAVLSWAEQQRQTLALHEADMQAQRQAMLATARKQEALAQLLKRSALGTQRVQARGEQKLQDDMAGQIWLRRSEV